jgi:G3E family GTPase
MYMKNFGEFFNDQVENAGCIILSHTDKASADKLATAVELLRGKNGTATLVTASWDSLDGKTILAAMEQKDCLQAELDRLAEEMHHHHHDEECHDPDCCCHHHHEEGHHHHHEEECDDPDCCCHHHHHEHEHGHGCHEHHHEHHHGHHHADEVFTSWGVETTRVFTKAELENALAEMQREHEYGTILRAKGIVAGEGCWLHFDYVPGEADVREGSAGVTGRLCVIGCNLNETALKELFNA